LPATRPKSIVRFRRILRSQDLLRGWRALSIAHMVYLDARQSPAGVSRLAVNIRMLASVVLLTLRCPSFTFSASLAIDQRVHRQGVEYSQVALLNVQ
jgi:hypothetical protein